MSHRDRIVSIASTLVLGACVAAGIGMPAKAQKKVYCWNENGRKICSDALPPEAANSARTEISTRSGLATGRVARALTDAERVEAKAAAEAARRQAEIKAIKQRHDLAMVESYTTEADLRRAYGSRTSLLDEIVKASQLGLTNQRLSLIAQLRQAGDSELARKPVPKRLADSIVRHHDDLLRMQHMLADQQQDRSDLDAELADAVRRYRELKAATSPASGTEGTDTQPTPPAT